MPTDIQDNVLKIRENERITIPVGVRVIAGASVNLPIEIINEPVVEIDASEPTRDGRAKQKTYMKKYVCPGQCRNSNGKLLTVRLTDSNANPGVRCGNCGITLVHAGD